MICLVAAMVLFLAVIIYDDSHWNEWASAHCTKIGKYSGSLGVGSDGKTLYIPGKTGWRCDDGTEYWR